MSLPGHGDGCGCEGCAMQARKAQHTALVERVAALMEREAALTEAVKDLLALLVNRAEPEVARAHRLVAP